MPAPACATPATARCTWAGNPSAGWARGWRWKSWPGPWPASPKASHEPAGRAQPGADPVPALVPDPQRAVLDLPAPAARPCAARLRRRLDRAVAGGVRLEPVLGARGGRSGLRAHVGPDHGHRDRLRRVPRGDDARVLPAPRAAARALTRRSCDQSTIPAPRAGT